MLDIDFFKKVNDRLGHQAGDEVLKMVAHSISGGIRDGDLACRWGGEEFLVALANPAPGQLSHIATRRCSLVRSSSIATVEGPLRVTVSIGATLSEPGMPPDRVIARADELLYESKHAGRDRVTCDTEPAPAEELAEAS